MHQSLELWHNREQSWLKKSSLLQEPIEDDVIIESLYSLVSMGTERLVISEGLTEAIAANMRVPYMGGDFGAEFTYGYSLVGSVVDGPDELINKIVHVMHPHQDVLRVKSNSVFIVPSDMDPKLATLASNMETAVNAVWDANIEIGDKILIIGYGTVGALIALIALNIAGVEVIVLEQDTNRSKSALTHGCQLYDKQDAFDVAFNTSSSEQMLQKAIRVTRAEGKIIELSWYGLKNVTLNLGADFHYGRKQIICSQVSHIPYKKQPLWSYSSRKELVFKLLKELNPIYLIDREVPYAKAPLFFNNLRKKKVEGQGVVIDYNH